MGLLKKVIGMCEESTDSDSSDVSMSTDSESEDDSVESDKNVKENIQNDEQNDENQEEDDEVVKAIIREREIPRDHPPNINCDDHVVDICFHPNENLLAVASITGDVLLYKYTNNENILIDTYELHLRACRDIEFDNEGKVLFSTAKDKAIMLTDVATGKLIKCYEDSHDVPVYCIKVIDENLLASGDDDGIIKLWDIREKCDKSILMVKKNEDYISDIITNDEKKYLLCSSGDGSLTTIDLVNRQYKLQSEEYDEELTCLGLFRSETKLLAGSSNGKMFLFNWNEFGLHSDEFPGPKTAINNMIPITENIVVTACEDGVLRATHLFPHRHLGIVGQHDLSVECVDICSNGTFIASSSHNNDIKFWNIQYFEDFNQITHKVKHNMQKDLQNNLPSSKQKNASDFFAGINY